MATELGAETRVRRGGGDKTLLWLEAIAGLAVVSALIGKSYGPAPTVFFMLTAVATAFTGWAIVRAFSAWSDESLDVVGRVRDEERERLEHEKNLILRGIKELESDMEIGKVDTADYAYLRADAESRALAIIQSLRDDDQRWMREAESLVRQRLGSDTPLIPKPAPAPASGPLAEIDAEPAHAASFVDTPAAWHRVEAKLRCSACQADNDEDGRYCAGCGRPREGAAE